MCIEVHALRLYALIPWDHIDPGCICDSSSLHILIAPGFDCLDPDEVLLDQFKRNLVYELFLDSILRISGGSYLKICSIDSRKADQRSIITRLVVLQFVIVSKLPDDNSLLFDLSPEHICLFEKSRYLLILIMDGSIESGDLFLMLVL